MKRGNLFSLFLLSGILTCMVAYSQEIDENHESHHHEHAALLNEVGGSVGGVFDITEKSIGLGIHLHYTRMFKRLPEKLGIGGGLEAVVLDHNHYNLSAMLVYKPFHIWWISAGPGIIYFTEDKNFNFSFHFETGLEFDLGAIHLGPMAEYAIAGSDQHLIIGIHLGYPF